MKFIYTPCKCKCIIFIYIHVSVSVKIYKMWFLLEVGRFHNVFEDKPAKWPIAKKKNHQNIHPQLIHMTSQVALVIRIYIIKLSIK
jgi:hypothetical protein